MVAQEEGEIKWHLKPHNSSWLALLAVLTGTLAVNISAFPYVTIVPPAAMYFGQSYVTINWIAFTVSAVSIPAVVLVSPAIRRFGIHVVVYISATCLLLGSILRCFSLVPKADQVSGTRGMASYALVHAGTAVMALALGPFQVAGTLVSTTFPREGRLVIHSMVRSILLSTSHASAIFPLLQMCFELSLLHIREPVGVLQRDVVEYNGQLHGNQVSTASARLPHPSR
jgi:hypothetical protein